ncbi:unnamed protein product [Prunus armeniaca]
MGEGASGAGRGKWDSEVDFHRRCQTVNALFMKVNLEKCRIFSREEGEDLRGWKNLQKIRRKKQLEVKIGVLRKVSMWDFVQVTVVVTRVPGIMFGSRELQQDTAASEKCLPLACRKVMTLITF